MKALFAVPLLVVAQGDAGAPPPRANDLVVSVERVDGVAWCSVRADNVPVHRVVGELARQLGLEVEGLDPSNRSALVTVELESRPLAQVLEYVLGGVGLLAEARQGTLSVRAFQPAVLAPAELLDLAVVAYLRAAGRFPTHPLGARARISQAEIEERRGNQSAALSHYEYVLESFSTSSLAPLAMLRAGLTLERMGLFGQASLMFRRLANIELQHGYHAEAWLGLARTANAVADHERALGVLAALDTNRPAHNALERRERLLERVRALVGLGQPMDALRDLDEAERLGLDAAQRRAAFALRASAFEALGLQAEASRSWLIYARESSGAERDKALESAARLTLAADDELGMLVLTLEADALGVGDVLAPYALEARHRLGIAAPSDAAAAAPLERLRLAEEWAAGDRLEEAADVVESLFRERARLDEDAIARVYRVRAIVLEREVDLETALTLLRGARTLVESLANKRRLDTLAAELCEKHSLYDLAVEAYGGNY